MSAVTVPSVAPPSTAQPGSEPATVPGLENEALTRRAELGDAVGPPQPSHPDPGSARPATILPAATQPAATQLATTLAQAVGGQTEVRLLPPLPKAQGRLRGRPQGKPPSHEPPHGSPAAALRDGLARGEIGVHYQPVVRLADRRPVMVEALARWHRAEAPVSPAAFVPLAESAGLVRELSIIVASAAVADMARHWPRLRLGVTINLPLALLLQPDLPSWLGRAMRHRGLGPAQVALELTETTPVLDLTQLHQVLLRLRRTGFRVLLDDVSFGDGRTRLHRLPFSGLKLDRSLVEQLPTDAHVRQQTRRLVRRAEARGQTVIAEGVSDRRIWDALRGLGVHFAQGFAVGRPLPIGALPGWWSGWRGGRQG
jgi:EAL domain-containing protein (putative c-di-GMP-specific phosphodiesterase class I)